MAKIGRQGLPSAKRRQVWEMWRGGASISVIAKAVGSQPGSIFSILLPFVRCHRRYGAPRLVRELRDAGERIAQKTVAKLLRADRRRHANRFGRLLAGNSRRNLCPKLTLDFSPMRGSPRRAHGIPAGQLLHPSSGSPHKHLLIEGVATTD